MIIFNNADHGHRIAKLSGCTFNPAVDTCISRWKDGYLLGGVIYQNFTGESIGIHMAGFDSRWVNKDMLWVSFDYPFSQLGVKRIFGQVPESNAKALELDLRLGFKIVTKIDGVFRDGGVIVIVLEREDCKWLDLKPQTLRRRQES